MRRRPDYPPEQVADFLRRSYMAVDGLWFVMAEERHSFEEALALDEKVWHVMPKIQCRKARELLGLQDDFEGAAALTALGQALGLKFAGEGHDYTTEEGEGELRFHITRCRWHEALVRSGREAIGSTICSRICEPEMRIWAAEFSSGITFHQEGRPCDGATACEMLFASE